MTDRLGRIGLLGGAAAAVLWTAGVFILEGVGNPADPLGGAEIAEFYRDDRVAIVLAATLHGLGGVLFLWFVAALVPRSRRRARRAGWPPRCWSAARPAAR